MRLHGPERPGGQGIDPEQEESANRAIHHLLTAPPCADQVDLVLTHRSGSPRGDGAYEAWARRGAVRFQRLVGDAGLEFRVVEVVGRNPLEPQDDLALNSVDLERAAAEASGFDPDNAATRFIDAEHQTYPFAYERIAQLFDSPNAPDLAISPKDWCTGSSPGNHGALHVRQSRAPLWFAGRGIRAGHHALAARSVDIAPTVLAALGFPLIDGADATGRTSSMRLAEPDVYLLRQDGAPVDAVLAPAGEPPKRLYVFLLDGLHHTELERRLATDPNAIPNLRRLRHTAAVLDGGSIVNFPSITWPSHTAIGTGTWCGHHDVVNPTYYLRAQRQTVSPQGRQIGTEGFANPTVESLAEAFHRVRPDSLTAAIFAPFGRSARHAPLEGRNLADKTRSKALMAEFAADANTRWAGEFPGLAVESDVDTRGCAQIVELLTRTDQPPPDLVYHEIIVTDGAGHEYGPHSEGLRDALDEADRRIGRVLDALDSKGLFDETLFVVTADHGMAPQDVTLNANPAAQLTTAGFAAVVAEPMVWLRDLHVRPERAPDHRTARVIVTDNDEDPDGERPVIEGARVVVTVDGRPIVDDRTDSFGVVGFATPSNIESSAFEIEVCADGFNERHVDLAGARRSLDLRAALYGAA